ncbi:hypothetical protein ACFL1A_01230 [Patescibacteria group bacterium]
MDINDLKLLNTIERRLRNLRKNWIASLVVGVAILFLASLVENRIIFDIVVAAAVFFIMLVSFQAKDDNDGLNEN